MQAKRIERRSWRLQVHELFSDPIGSPAVWNEIGSYDGRAFMPRDWCNLAFDAAHSGQLSFLKWLIRTKKVPVLIKNEKGCNLLHAAVSFGQESIAEWLLDRRKSYAPVFELLLSKSKRGRTALETAVCSNQLGMVGCLLNIEPMGMSTQTSQVIDVIRHCCQSAEPAMANYLSSCLQTLEIRAFLFNVQIRSDQDVESFIAEVSAFSWWGSLSTIEWSEIEKFAMYAALLSATQSHNVDLVEWLLNKWKVPLQPPSLYEWKGLSIADVVIVEKIHDDEFLENCGGDVEDDDLLWKHHTKRFFDMMVSGRWEDGQTCSLISTLEPLIYQEKADRYLKNKWFEVLCEHGYEHRLAVLKILSQKYEDHGAQSFSLPRLDLVVACSELHTLQWLIDSKFVNLDAMLAPNAEAVGVDEQDEAKPADDDDNICAICYSVKRLPQELHCGHSYCLSCIRQLHSYASKNMQSFQCPYCRRHITVPPSMTVSASLQYYLLSKSPWLQYQSSNTIGQILMALAAGTGSVFILEYLITQQHIDPLTTLFAHGRNILHIAASRGSIVACKWLCLNGYLQLASHLSDQQLSPVHEAICCPIYSASLVFDLFEELVVLPENWIALATASPNADIVKRAEFFLSHKLSDRILELLGMNAPLDQLIPVIENSSFGRCEILDQEFIRSMFEYIIQNGRADVLSWMYESCLRRRVLYFNRHKEFICTKIGECIVNSSAMIAFINKVDAAYKCHRQIAKCSSDFTELILNGAPVTEIEKVINQQNELISEAQNLSLKEDVSPISFKNIIRHGLNALEMAAHHNHLHLVDWILNKRDLDTTQSAKQVLSRAIEDGNSALFEYTLSWLDKHSQPIPTSISVCEKEHEPLLHAVVWRFSLSCHGLSVDEQLKAFRAWFEVAKLLIDRADIDVNALNDEKQTALYHLADIVYFGREGHNALEVISDWILEMTQILVNAGIDVCNIDDSNKTYLERVLSRGSSVQLKSIRWLALVKGVDIQFVQFQCSQFDRKLSQQTKEEFEVIRKEQRALQSAAVKNDH